MNLIKVFQKTIFFIVIMLIAGIYCDICGQSENMLDRKVEIVEIEAFDFSTTLPQIAKIFDIPIGFENSENDNSGKQIIHLKNATLKEVLDLVITQSNPAYCWTISDDGVINVFPKENRDSFLEELLKVRIEKFSIENNVSNIQVRTKITNLPEIKSEMSKKNLRPLNLAFFSSEIRKTNKFEISLENISLRELLNKIIKKSGSNFWVVSRYGKQREFLIIDF